MKICDRNSRLLVQEEEEVWQPREWPKRVNAVSGWRCVIYARLRCHVMSLDSTFVNRRSQTNIQHLQEEHPQQSGFNLNIAMLGLFKA